MIALEWALWVLVGLLAVPTLMLLLQALVAALFPRLDHKSEEAQEYAAWTKQDLAVLIPAHNEEATLNVCLDKLVTQVSDPQCILLIAHNCDDATAQIAEGYGIRVEVFNDPNQRGKGYALATGIDRLKREGNPKSVLVLDADSTLSDHAIEQLNESTTRTGRPCQAVYLLGAPQQGNFKQQVSWFAFCFKNLVRPLGMHRLGLPCHITGTGWITPWPLFEAYDWSGEDLVEDMSYGLSSARQGLPPLLVTSARVDSPMAVGDSTQAAQRTRWEHGHLQTLLRDAIPTMLCGLRRFDLRTVGLGLDLIIPPLALLSLVLAGLVAVTALGSLVVGTAPLIAASSLIGVLLLAVGLGWLVHGRSQVPLSTLLYIPVYLLWKVPIYASFLVSRQRAWVRTSRESSSS